MLDASATLLRGLHLLLEPAASAEPSLLVLLLGAALGVAAIAVVVTARRAIPAIVAADRTGAPTRLRQTVDVGRLLAQSDPDAAGRPRPRAPGRGIPAA